MIVPMNYFKKMIVPKIRAMLEKNGKIIGPNDLIIASYPHPRPLSPWERGIKGVRGRKSVDFGLLQQPRIFYIDDR